ncbi:hypothetical protein ACO1KB_13395 [Leptospira interrogans serovar Szwajizak]|uniref:hypothetical protein n=1 Tax=Leptospira interrogans TaxID=173 RepID=UPI0003493E95|nr:hypothetical protein [Leptospira interrogans]
MGTTANSDFTDVFLNVRVPTFILQTNLSFVVVPTLEYDRFNFYKLELLKN